MVFSFFLFDNQEEEERIERERLDREEQEREEVRIKLPKGDHFLPMVLKCVTKKGKPHL